MNAVKKIDRLKTDPVGGGFYTMAEATRLLGLANPGRVRDWVVGRQRGLGPVLARQYEPLAGVQEVGFWDLIEVRFIEHFRRHGIPLQSLRRAAQTARQLWKVQHPFATSKAQFMSDRQSVFEATARDENDTALLNLVTRQYAMYVVIEEVLDKGITFDPASGLAAEFRPRASAFPNVVISPIVAFGQPCIRPIAVPTATIFNTWKSEDGDYQAVSDWFGIDESLAKQAVEFELSLPN
jgi:uncharacterized protein (DUF433 family)